MCAISNTVLQEMWEKLTNCKFNTNDGKPCLVCYICCAQLRKCSQLRKRALKAEELLPGFFNNALKQTQEALSAMASETDLDYSYVTKQLYQGECKEFEKDIIVEIKKEIESESEENNAVEIEIDIKEEKDDALQEDKLDLADTKPRALSTHNEHIKKEVLIILEKIDTETPMRKRISNEVPQKAKRIKLDETTKDKNGLANAVLKSLPNNKCKASVRSSSKKLSVFTNVKNFKSKPNTKLIPNFTLVDKISSKINTLPKDNDQTENIVLNNKTLSSNLCYNDAENEIFERSLPKSADAVATSTSIDACGQGNTSNVFNRKGPENKQLCHTYQQKCVPKSELNSHPPEHIGVQLYARDVSDYGFTVKANSDNHLKYKHAKERNFSCHICQYKCTAKSILNKHLRTHTGEKPYMCHLCKYRCVQKNTLITHIKYKHTKEKNFSCHICQYKCVEKGNLNRHLLKHTGKKPYICDLCDYRCVQKNALIIHIKYKHTKEKNFSCHICQYKCVEKGTLNRHLLKHTSEKPHVCDFCDYRCSRKSYLKRHITYKHTKEKNFSCHICQYKCSEKKYLNRHLFKHTGEKPYICNLCDYGCVQKNMLISHIKYKHTKEKNFSCHICQYKCVEKSNLNKHLLKHTGEKPYICDLCGYRCVQKNMLVSHTKHKHTKEKT